mgnify:CR=1 FL=1
MLKINMIKNNDRDSRQHMKALSEPGMVEARCK